MTFKEAKKKKNEMKSPFFDEESNTEMRIVIIPMDENDQKLYWDFIDENFNSFDDEDVKRHSKNGKYVLGTVGKEEVSGQFIFNDALID